MPSITAFQRSPPDVTSCVDSRPIPSAVENSAAINSSVPSSSSAGVNGSNVNVWLNKEADDELQHAVEMSQLLTTSENSSSFIVKHWYSLVLYYWYSLRIYSFKLWFHVQQEIRSVEHVICPIAECIGHN